MRFVKSFVHTIHPRECQKSLKKISFSKIKVNKLHCGEMFHLNGHRLGFLLQK